MHDLDLQRLIGREAWTPYEPRGRVRIVCIETPHPLNGELTCQVEYLHDHAGHARGTTGRYFLKDIELASDNPSGALHVPRHTSYRGNPGGL